MVLLNSVKCGLFPIYLAASCTCCFVLPLCIPSSESLFTVVAGNGDTFNVICLNVVLDISCESLFSTNSADSGSFATSTIFYYVFVFGHHGVYLFIQSLQIPTEYLICCSYSSIGNLDVFFLRSLFTFG